MLAIKTILHPTDFSYESDNAFNLAAALARDYHARLILLHVADAPVIVFGEGVVPPQPVQYQQALRRRLEELRVPDGDGLVIERELVEGNPAAQILQKSKACGCDLIVMGTHGRTGLNRLLLGSVAEQVLRGAGCMVLTVKDPVRQSVSEEATARAARVLA